MTPPEFAAAMRVIAANDDDWEVRHGDADTLLCEMLEELGYAEGVAVFDAMDRWYA